MSFFETLEKLFGTRDLYEVLRLTKSASESEIKRAYRKKSLEVHPDRVPEAEKASATEKFQLLSRVYSVLSDQDKRALYDESGEVDDDVVVQERDWDAYWRLLFQKITMKDITEFEKNYKGSEEEVNDLRSAYLDYEGDMDTILENVLCSTIGDYERFRIIIQDLISKEDLPTFPAFANEDKKKKKSRKQKAQREAAEAAEVAKELGLNDKSDDGLKQLIMKRQKQRQGAVEDMIAGLEAKYCKPKKPKTSKGKKK
ncbi:dnaJ homolog subfamily C member 9-like [Stylophora pistillata]|uniref:DnaJ-like subfamily C member 9 n=1 Tax=Stylophora pistillata TaxID=50429 RepID=A0A2B4RLT5_STYPI|nr:dnaJ homolog subfamily C member 9-like [Stylophora pistillata]PFX19374.1 DnaJ-like subfamily C member 9 [Stylophora pistillata]